MGELKGCFFTQVQDWENNVDCFFEWMLDVNGYFESSWIFENLKKNIISKADLDEWYILFSDQYNGDFDYIDQCSISFIRGRLSKQSVSLI